MSNPGKAGRGDEKMVETPELLTLEETLAEPLLSRSRYPWEALDGISGFIKLLGETLPEAEYEYLGDDIWVARSAVIAPSANISGPCIIGRDTEVRPCAFIRGSALVGDGCVVGNSTELKNVILFNCVQVPHYNYVGDSILGYRAHMGAGSITSNVKSDRTPVTVRAGSELLETGRKKFGAILGDFVEVGCNTVLNPGTVVGRRTSIYPLSCVRGWIPEDSIFKSPDNIVKRT